MSFEHYQAERRRLEASVSDVSRLWSDIRSTRTEIENLSKQRPQSDESAVEQLMKEASARLASDTIEVGVFGAVKRGKSTLINALVGEEVSSMRVTPETAVPVWIESGSPTTSVYLADGTVLEDLSVEDALLMSTQRHKSSNPSRKPIRVRTRRRIEWLPTGVRLVDTPGLDDPSLSEDYERLTLAELDRVAAALVVIVSPPGASGDEIRLIKSLSERGVDKLFLVCNMYPDHWNDNEVREEMRMYLEDTVLRGAGDRLDRSDVRVYMLSAKQGFRASVEQNREALDQSGVMDLRRDLEAYLTRGSLTRMLEFVERRTSMACQLMADTLADRRAIVADPSALEPRLKSLSQEIESSRRLIGQFETRLRTAAKEMTEEIDRIVSRPISTALGDVSEAKTSMDIERILNRLQIQMNTATSEASTAFEQRSGLEHARLHRELFESFGTEHRLANHQLNLGFASLAQRSATPIPATSTDWNSIGTAGVVAGGATGVASATLLGGAGIALLATGPVGWLIGLGIGALFGGSIGALVAGKATRNNLKPEHRHQVADDLRDWQSDIHRRTSSIGHAWAENLQLELERLRSAYFSDKQADLDHVRRVIEDHRTREAELSRLDSLATRVNGLTPR